MARLPVFACVRSFAAALVLALVLAAPASADIRVALVIGNGAYRNVPRLPNPANDASDVAAALRRTGFDVILATDVDKNHMEEATIRFARAARTADVALFYYSGHALQFAGVNYLAPVDAVMNDEADLRRMTRVDDIVADLQQAKNLRILVLDSCRDNPLAEQLRRSIGATRAVPLQRGLAKIDTPQGMIVAYATQAGQTAEDGDGRNSPYTRAFLNHIEEQDEIGTIFREVSEDVYDTTRHTQLPELSLSMIGRFYLRGMPTPAAAAPIAAADSAKSDFEAAERVDTVGAWEAYLKRHKDGFYADLAQERRTKALSKVASRSDPAQSQGALGGAVPANAPAAAAPGNVKALFEKYKLLGTFAFDCSKPASRDNTYLINRLRGDGAIERVRMSSPTTTDWVAVLDKANELKPSEVAVSGTRDGKPTEGVWHIEDKRMIQVEVSLGGEKLVTNRRLPDGREVPWLNRCDVMLPGPATSDRTAPVPAVPPASAPKAATTGAPNGVKAIFEKYRLLGTFAVDCSKPASSGNLYYTNRLRSDGMVERHQMSGPTTTDWVTVLDKANELKPNEIAVGGTRDGKSGDAVWRIEDKRMRQMEVSLGGEKFVSDARLLQGGREMPWLYRCDGG